MIIDVNLQLQARPSRAHSGIGRRQGRADLSGVAAFETAVHDADRLVPCKLSSPGVVLTPVSASW